MSSETPFDESVADPDPFAQFRAWFEGATAAGLHEPTAMILATVDGAGRPSARAVLLKGIDARGFVFFTNYGSRKARELAGNPHAALVFLWTPLQRQVRVEGVVERVSAAESDAYFASRPRGSQLGAWASAQSEPVASRAELDTTLREVTAHFAGRNVPRPSHWGGLRVVPEAVEFWQGRRDRMHDRLLYSRAALGWTISRLSP